MAKIANSRYIADIEHDIAHDPKSFWRYMQQKKYFCCSCKSFDGRVVDTPLDIVSSFGEYFARVYDPVSFNTEHLDIKNVNNNLINLPVFAEAD